MKTTKIIDHIVTFIINLSVLLSTYLLVILIRVTTYAKLTKLTHQAYILYT